MIPVKWYIAVMVGAGVVMFLYGIGTGEIRTIFGSFLFLGIGGGFYFANRKRD